MHFLLIPVGSFGDVHPFVGIALKLKERGHDVTFAANGHFKSLALREGLDFHEVSSEEDYQNELRDPDIWRPIKGVKRLMEMLARTSIRPLYYKILDLVRPGKTIIVAPAIALGARVAQEKHKIPLVTIALQPSIFRSHNPPPVFIYPGYPTWVPPAFHKLTTYLTDKCFLDPILCPELNRLRSELSLPPITRVMDQYWVSPENVIGLFPEWFAKPLPEWPKQLQLAGFPLYDEKGSTQIPPDLNEFLNAGPAPVVFTPGSAMAHGAEFFQEAVDACRKASLRAIFFSRFTEQIPKDLPDSIRHFDYVPFSEVFPRAAAVVHHGGIGTCSQAMRAGVPQLIMPLSFDQPDNAVRLEKLGIGRTILPKKFKAPAIAKALEQLIIDPNVKNNTAKVAEKFHGVDGLTKVCEILEELKPMD
jgi:UDP:flavonoid glycosyltransferase YjiC (YdhE family)